MKNQVVVIHGGDTYDTYEEYFTFLKNFEINFEKYRTGKKDWKYSLRETLGDDYEIILPDMPNKLNAKYIEWKIWFEKFIPHLQKEVILAGHSLGGIFLAKYLSENELPLRIKALFLVAAPYNNENADYSLADFTLSGNFKKLEKQVSRIFLYHSSDDPVVPFIDLAKYQKGLKNATARVFNDRGHFNQEKFNELVEDIEGM